MVSKLVTVSVAPENVGYRADRFLTGEKVSLTRSQIHKFFDSGQVTISGRVIKASYRIKGGEQISVNVVYKPPLKVNPEPIKIDIVYEDDYVIVVDKPAGMVVHPGAGNWNGTLVNALLYHSSQLSGMGGDERPGIVHRLDKDTSGLLVVAKDNISHENLSRQLQERSVTRRYLAIVLNRMSRSKGEISAPIGRHPGDRKKMSVHSRRGKEARTIYKVLHRFNKNYTLLELRLKTGRTHQIRVHLTSIGYPLLGDRVYGHPKTGGALIARQALHAVGLEFIHPKTKKRLKFSTRLPYDFKEVLFRISS